MVAALIMASIAPNVGAVAGCNSQSCFDRSKARAFAKLHGGCYSMACVRRVHRKNDPREIGRRMARLRGTPFSCVDQLIHRESRWQVTATNASSGAYGLPQSLPAHKMASEGADWRTNARTQLRWFFNYVKARYGGACAALAHSHARGWY